jgi:hypothetical protein
MESRADFMISIIIHERGLTGPDKGGCDEIPLALVLNVLYAAQPIVAWFPFVVA